MPAPRLPVQCATAMLVSLLTAAAAPTLFQVRVQAGASDRLDTPVGVTIPALDALLTTVLLTEVGAGRQFPGQVDRHGDQPRLRFILAGSTPAGTERRFAVSAGEATPGVTVSADNDGVEIRQYDRPVLRYRRAAVAPPAGQPALLARSAYLHPVWTPAGKVVTGDFAADHPHQRGVFLAWTKTAYQDRHPDFWNLAQGSGRVRTTAVRDFVSGPVWGGFEAAHVHEDLKAPGGPVTVLDETWQVSAWALGGGEAGWWLWDLDIRQSVAGTAALHLPKYHYGGMAFRGCDAWVKGPWEFLTSTGRTRADADATTGAWGDLSGPLDATWGGLTMIGHPDNLRFPQPFRCHPGTPYICMAPSQQGPWSIAPGAPLRLRYRFVVHDGKVDGALADRLFRDVAAPPLVTVDASPQ